MGFSLQTNASTKVSTAIEYELMIFIFRFHTTAALTILSHPPPPPIESGQQVYFVHLCASLFLPYHSDLFYIVIYLPLLPF